MQLQVQGERSRLMVLVMEQCSVGQAERDEADG